MNARRLRLLSRLLAAVALLLVGAAGGWAARGSLADDEAGPLSVSVERPLVAVENETSDGLVPNVVGLSETQARQAMYDAGFADDQVVAVAAPAGGDEGVILAQDPPPRTAGASQVNLYVSEATTVPDLRGLTLDEARDQLRQVGVFPVVARTYEPTAEEGTVIATDPPAGQTLPGEVTVTLAASPSAVFASALRAIESDGCRYLDDRLGGVDYDNSLRCSAEPSAEDSFLLYQLYDGVAWFEATLGLTDNTRDGVAARVRVSVDGVEVFTTDLSTPDVGVPLRVSVFEGQQLRIDMIRLDGETAGDVYVLLGDAVFLGSREGIDTLEAEHPR